MAALAALLAAAAVLATVLLRPQPPVPDGSPVGETIAVDPAATIATPPGAAATARLQSPVRANDRIETGPDGAIRVRFVDRSFFSLGANGGVRIDSFVFDPQRRASRLSLDFLHGAFRFVSGEPVRAYPGQQAIVTPVAAIGIRGTGVTGVIGPEALALYRRIDPGHVPDGGDSSTATLILLTQGAIDVAGSGVRIALDVPGQGLFFPRRGAPPIGPFMVPPGPRTEIGALASPPSLGPEPGATPTTEPSPSPSPPPIPTPIPTPTRAATPTPAPVTETPLPQPATTPGVPSGAGTPTPGPRPTFRPPFPRPSATPSPQPTFRPPIARPTATPSPRPTFRPPLRTQPTPSPSPTPQQPGLR